MSNVGAISDWGALTAAQIQQYEQEGYDVPVEYRQWADSATNIYVTYDDAQTQYKVSDDSDTSVSGLSGNADTESTDEESFNAHNPASVFKAGGVADDKSSEAEESGEKADSESASNKKMTKKLKTKFAALNKDVKKNQNKVKTLTTQKNAKNQEISQDQDELDQTNDEIEEAIQEDQDEQKNQDDQQKIQGAGSKKPGVKTRAVAPAAAPEATTSEMVVPAQVVLPQDEKANSTGIGVNSAFSLKLADEDKKAPVKGNRAMAKGKNSSGAQNGSNDNAGSDTIATRSAAISQMANLYSTQAAAAMAVSVPVKAPNAQLSPAQTNAGQAAAATVAAPAVATRAMAPTRATNNSKSSEIEDKQATADALNTKIASSTVTTSQLASQITTTNTATSKDYQEIEKLINEAKKQAAESQKDSSGGQKVAEKFESVGKTIQTVGGAAIAVGVALVATGWATVLGKVLETYGAYASYAGGGLAAISEAVQGKWGACLMTAVEVGAVAAAQATGLIGGAGGAAGSGAGSAANGAFKIGTQTYNANGELIAGYL